MLEIERLDTIRRNALESLQRVFPYGVRVRRYKNASDGTFRSCQWFCTAREKPHSMTHWADNYSTVGRIRIISTVTSVTESRMKTAVKTRRGRP